MMLLDQIFPLALLVAVVSSSPVKRPTTENVGLLTAISKDPELSTFYSLFNSTGGNSGIPAPPFEERFNRLDDGRKYTAFAPVNSAFEALPPGLVAAMTAPSSYVLLEALLRSHIVEGLKTKDDVCTPDKSMTSIEGIPLQFHSSGSTTMVNSQAALVSTESIPAGNGAIFKLTSLLEPLSTIFGTSVHPNGSIIATPSPAPQTPQLPSVLPSHPKTLAGLLASSKDLSTYTELLKTVSPAFFSLLDASQPTDKHLSLFAPSNAALEAMGQMTKAIQPANQPFTAYLLEYPFIDVTVAGKEKSVVGFPATVRRGEKGAVESVNNAVVEGERRCVGNVCVYVVDRWLDPCFGLF